MAEKLFVALSRSLLLIIKVKKSGILQDNLEKGKCNRVKVTAKFQEFQIKFSAISVFLLKRTSSNKKNDEKNISIAV